MSALFDTVRVVRIGRTHALHTVRVVIEPPTGRAADQRVVVRTSCGINAKEGDMWTRLDGFVTCEACKEATT